MENAIRTTQYLAMMEQRRRELTGTLQQIFSLAPACTWELGCGHGHFLTAYAQAHPEKLCVGVDLIRERIERATRKRDRARLPNLHFVHAEARLFLATLPPDVRFREVFILFPDPWPKVRHHKHRILQSDFLDAVAARAEPGCQLCFRTDFTPYYSDARATVAEHSAWQLVEEPWPFEYETVFQQRAPTHHSFIARRRSP